MRILLDTHIALWAIADTSKLSDEMIQLLESCNNEIFYSIASVWEIAIKHKIKPENMPLSEEKFVELCDLTGFVQLPIRNEHIYYVKTLERAKKAPKHNDPFDRMLLAQAKAEYGKRYLMCVSRNYSTHRNCFVYCSHTCGNFSLINRA